MAGLTPKSLARKRRLARAALWVEQVWPAVWPALGVVGGFLILALLDVPAWLPPWPRALLPVVALLLAAGLLWRGLSRVARPGGAEVDRRLEQDSGLRHRPLAALQDRPASPTEDGLALWALYQARLMGQLARLRVGRPRPGLAGRDRRALRYLALLGLAVAVAIAGPEGLSRVMRAAWPPLPAGAGSPGTVVQAWLTPPGYTGLPPVFLQQGATPQPIPAGSRLTVSVTGGYGTPSLSIGAEAGEFKPLDTASWQAERTVPSASASTEGARLSVTRGGSEIAGWNLHVVADKPPVVSFAEPPGAMTAGRQGERQGARTRLGWKAEDDYGLALVQGELRLRDRPDAPPLVLKGSLAGAPKQARGAIVQDLTAHPWAGLAVVAQMVAQDAAGQQGRSAEAGFLLPERVFSNPVAQAVIAVRKQLSLTPDQRREAQMALGLLADRPDLYDGSTRVTLALRAAGALLVRGRGQAAVDEAQARLWALALSLEEGAADRTAQALAQARQDVHDAMEAAREAPQDPAAQTELDKRIEALREAIQKHIEALVQQARRDGTETPLDPTIPQMNARDLDRMAKQAEDAAREGRMDDAKQQMAQLERLLEQLQNARPEQGQQREQRRAQQRQQGQDQMDAVQDIVKREGALLDRSRQRTDPGQGATRPSQTAQPQQEQRGKDERVQQAMRRALGELMQRYGDLTGQVPAPLGEADTAMRDAGQAMADGRDSAAGAAQQRAIEALQKGGRSMSQQLSRQLGVGEQQGEGEDGQEMGEGEQGQDGRGDSATSNQDGPNPRPGDQGRRRSGRRDPLGRPLPEDIEGAQGNNGEGLGSQPIPSEQEQARARDLQEELRRRGADRTRPQPELDYIDRLLKSF